MPVSEEVQAAVTQPEVAGESSFLREYPRRKGGWQRRIDKLIRERGELRTENAELRDQVAVLKAAIVEIKRRLKEQGQQRYV